MFTEFMLMLHTSLQQKAREMLFDKATHVIHIANLRMHLKMVPEATMEMH